MEKSSSSLTQVKKIVPLICFFAAMFFALFVLFRGDTQLENARQKLLYPGGLSLILSALATLWLGMQARLFGTDKDAAYGRMYFPVLSGLLALIGMALAYTFLGMWPIGEETGMIVDMHHQYAPLLSELRDMLLNGGSPLYSFEVGTGTSFLPLFGYYLASPFNLLLVLFPEHLLAEGILFITLLKNMLTAVLFAVCVQYIYGRKSYAIPAAAVMYSMMMYLLAYSWDLMWLDCIMVLPLVVMGFEKLMREGRWLTYVLSLAYILYANYYIGFMICVFLVLYYIAYFLRTRRSGRQQLEGFVRFAVGSLLGGLIAMFLLLPVVMALGQTSAAGGGFRVFDNNFDLFDLFGQSLYGMEPTIRSSNLPNLYCGILSVFLLPIFASTRAIPRRRRIAYVGMWLVLAFSLVINNLDLLWHGLHAPNDLPYRFSFLYSFVLVLIAYETLCHLSSISGKQILGSLGGLAACILLVEKFDAEDELGFAAIYISLALLGIYALITFLVSRRKMFTRVAYVLLLVVVFGEMVTNASETFVKLDENEHFTAHASYVDNETTRAVQKTVEAMQRLGDAEQGGDFYRLEFAPRRTTVDTALFGYRGITVFASTNSYQETRMMNALGYTANGVNSHQFRNFMPVSDSLLGIRYIALNSTVMQDSPLLVERETVQLGSESYTIYENPYALPLGFFVQPTTKNWKYSYYNPVVTQNSLLKAMTGNEADVLETLPVVSENNSAEVSNTSSFRLNANSTAKLSTSMTEASHVYIYVDCRAAESISVKAGVKSWGVTTYMPYLIDAGELSAGDTVTATIKSKSTSCSGNLYVIRINEEVFRQDMQTLSANGMEIETFTDSHIEGTVTAPQDGTICTTITYDPGWTVKVDGKKVETVSISEAWLAFDVPAGTHTVELSFLPRGLIPGCVLTVIGIAGLVLLVLATRRRRQVSTQADTPYAWDITGEDVRAIGGVAEEEALEEATPEKPVPDPADAEVEREEEEAPPASVTLDEIASDKAGESPRPPAENDDPPAEG